MNADKMRTAVLLLAAGIAAGVWFTSVRAHQGHDHAAHTQRERAPQGEDRAPRESQAEVKFGSYERSLQAYVVPDVTLVNANSRPIRMHELFAADGPVMLDFIFTNCTTNCPVSTREFSMVPEKLGAAAPRLRMISVSIDPDNDTPAQLKAYARQFGAGANWQFLTGSRQAIDTLRQAFDSDRDNQLELKPVVFLRPAPGMGWVRINGFASAEELAREYRTAVSN